MYSGQLVRPGKAIECEEKTMNEFHLIRAQFSGHSILLGLSVTGKLPVLLC